MNIHCLQHVAFENPGSIKDWAEENYHTINYTYFFEDSFVLPHLKDIDVLIIMGGNMNVDEEKEYPWLNKEKELIRAAIDTGKKVIGICLGSQLIVAALGSKVYSNKEKEIGFFPVQFLGDAFNHPLFNHFTNPYVVFHWHGDTFDLPANTQLIASSEACKHQAYLIGDSVLGFQFHFEMNQIIIDEMIKHDGKELEEAGKYIQSKQEIQNSYEHLLKNKKDLFTLLNKFLA